MNEQTGRHILITGASSGIGAALALHYAAPGVFLVLSGRDSARLADLAGRCRDKGAAVQEEVADVADRAVMKEIIERADRQRPLDLVIANAGISGGTGGAGAEPGEQARRIFAVNLDGVMNTIDPVLPRMMARRRGQVAVMSSLASFSGWPGAPAYSASKGAVRLYGEALRGGMAGHGVKVNVICPGFIRTPMTAVNNYRMPFMMDADRAAAIIVRGLGDNRARIAFPLPTYMLAGFFGMMPCWLSQKIFAGLPAKPQADSV